MKLLNLFNNEEDENKFFEGIIQKIKERETENEKFIKEKQDSVMELVYQFLKNESTLIDNEDILYFKDRYKFSEREFCMLCENILTYAERANIAYINKSSFQNMNCCLSYKGLKITVRTAVGQGTIYQMRTDFENEWDEQKVFSYDEYKSFITNSNL